MALTIIAELLKEMVRKALLFGLAAFFVVCLSRFCSRQTEGFALYKICSDLPFCKEWETLELPNEKVLSLFDQPFHYLAKGAQSYVFISEDKNTVIKFFRLYHLRPPLWLSFLSFPYPFQLYKIQKMLDKRQELIKDFSSYKIAFDEMKEQTGLLYLHLNKTACLNKKLTFYDKIGIRHIVDLDQMEFLVQKKASLVFPAIEHLMQTEGLSSAKEAITALVNLLLYRCKIGIFDKDPDLNTNFGFFGTTPLQIDIGRFQHCPTIKGIDSHHDEIIRITDNFRQWLDQHYPPLSEHLLQEIEQIR